MYLPSLITGVGCGAAFELIFRATCYQCISTLRSQSLHGRELLLSSLPRLFLSGFCRSEVGTHKGRRSQLGIALTQQQLAPTRIIWPSSNTVVNQRRVMGSSVSFLWQQLGGPEGNNLPAHPAFSWTFSSSLGRELENVLPAVPLPRGLLPMVHSSSRSTCICLLVLARERGKQQNISVIHEKDSSLPQVRAVQGHAAHSRILSHRSS